MPLKKSAGNMYNWVTHCHSHLGGECSHKCKYCLDGKTHILMSNGEQKQIKDINIGDKIVGAAKDGGYYKYISTFVLGKFETEQKAYKIVTKNGTEIICGPDHRWKSSRGKNGESWKFTTNGIKYQRPHLTNKIGISCVSNSEIMFPDTKDYKTGYLCSSIWGDAHLAIHKYYGRGREETQYHFRLACKDEEIVNTVESYLKEIYGVHCHKFLFPMKDRSSKKTIQCPSIRLNTKDVYEKLIRLVKSANVKKHSDEWFRGFLAGAFDAEGGDTGTIRIFNTDFNYLDLVAKGMDIFGLLHKRESSNKRINNPCFCERLIGGVKAKSKFFISIQPKIKRKFGIFNRQVKGSIRVISIEDMNKKQKMYDIMTGSENYFANGLLSHNCYVQAMEKRFKSGRYSGPVNLIEDEFKVNYGKGKTIFIEHMNDLFAKDVPDDWILRILAHTNKYPDNTYVFQTKNPDRFLDFCLVLPEKYILGTTIESNRIYAGMSEAPTPEARMKAMSKITNTRKFLTIEPVLDFDVDILAEWINNIKPEFLNLGADSKGQGLIEPTVEKIMALVEKLKEYGIELREKHNLKRLTERQEKAKA